MANLVTDAILHSAMKENKILECFTVGIPVFYALVAEDWEKH